MGSRMPGKKERERKLAEEVDVDFLATTWG